jgi:hypothetical protein
MKTQTIFSLPAVIAALGAAEHEVAEFFGSLAPELFVLRVEMFWTPAEHLVHLNTSVNAVARGFALPQWLLRLRFGGARRPSRGYEQVRDEYRARLAGGAGATGVYVPRLASTSLKDAGARQAELVERWHRVNGRLAWALGGWSEQSLDRIQLPHPILGMLTAREMLFFTIYHNHHHVPAARARLPGRDPRAGE